jgi:ABC-type antimicrobial peptide transport system permease subunit
MIEPITKEIQALDPEMPVFDVGSMDQRLHDSLARRRFSMFMLGLFAVVASILAAIGIYGVMAYSVNERTHEIGIRLALGAPPAKVRQLVLRQAMVLTSAGLASGLAAAFALTRIMSSLLYGVSATDVLTFVVTPLLLGGVALLASYIPARRAAQVDPMIALRCE